MHIVANWKMNQIHEPLTTYFNQLKKLEDKAEIIVCPPYLYLSTAHNLTHDDKIAIGSQNVASDHHPSLTGEISAQMLRDVGVKYTIVGHSERRTMLAEDPEMIRKKILCLLDIGIKPILCVGERADDNTSGKTRQVLEEALESTLGTIPPSQILLAYEPIWAIGMPAPATPTYIENVLGILTEKLNAMWGGDARKIPILYGGGVKPDNVAEIMTCQGLGGFLCGSVSLKSDSFKSLIQTVIAQPSK